VCSTISALDQPQSKQRSGGCQPGLCPGPGLCLSPRLSPSRDGARHRAPHAGAFGDTGAPGGRRSTRIAAGRCRLAATPQRPARPADRPVGWFKRT
jgi:hypothetical protein